MQSKRSVDLLAPIALNKEGSKLYFFDYDGYQPYNLQTTTWEEPVTKLDMGGYVLSPITDTMHGQNGQVNVIAFDPSTGGAPSVVLTVPTSTSWLDHGVYNSVRKSLFFLASGVPTGLYEFHSATKNWAAVVSLFKQTSFFW